MRHLLLSAVLLASPAAAQDEPAEAESSAPEGGQGAHVGGAGIQAGERDNAAGGERKTTAGGGPGSGTSGSSGPCAEEDLNWKPGKGGPSTSVQGQAMRAQGEDTTIAYRIRASQLGAQGNFGFYTDSHTESYMRLSNKKCEVALKVSPCEASYGSVTLWYLSAAKLKQLSQAPGFKKDAASRICVIPAPAGKIGGEDYWWLNVHTKGPCPGGRGWFGGGKTEDGQCVRAILYEAHDMDGKQAGHGAGAAAPPPAAPKPNKCWKAPSGRQCCDVMFSPVPAECRR
ncbi:MAG: hypothetical protein M0D55_18760 [Elusimicrobiota bacterium]|nr:MAG: hypothetical protein M0D55_18760 [Elusimicrobiota bacterium]